MKNTFGLYKKHIGLFINFLILLILTFVLYKKVPTIFNSFRLENSKIESASIKRISGEEVSVPNAKRNKIVIFWATWCEPCHYEMRKLSDLIAKSVLRADDLIAISIDEKKDVVIDFIEKENYPFIVAHDFDGSLSRQFNISATPTFLFINKNSNLDWVSTGVSPTLERRVREFLKN